MQLKYSSMKIISLIFLILFSNILLFAQDKYENLDDKGTGLMYGFYLLENENITEAEETFQKYTKSLESIKKRRDAIYEISLKYNDKLYYDLSISYALEGVKGKEKDSYLVKELLQVILINHIELGNFDLAEDYYYKSIDIGESVGAIMNLEAGNFRGLTLLNKDLNIMPLESLERLLASIVISE